MGVPAVFPLIISGRDDRRRKFQGKGDRVPGGLWAKAGPKG